MANTFSSLLDLVYPVGSWYFSSASTSPSSLFGGNWTANTSGRLLRPQGSNNTAGSFVHQHHMTSSGSGWAVAQVGCSNHDIAHISYNADVCAYELIPGTSNYIKWCTDAYPLSGDTFSPNSYVEKYTTYNSSTSNYTTAQRTWTHNVSVFGWTAKSQWLPASQNCYAWNRNANS